MRTIRFSAYCFFAAIVIIFCFNLNANAQVAPSLPPKKIIDTIPPKEAADFGRQRDLIDLAYLVLHKNPASRLDSTGNKNTRLYFTVAPIVEFTTATGFSPGVAGNVAFMTSVKQQTNTSSILGAVKYTQKNQLLMPFQSSVWTSGNRFNLLGDWRFLIYPQDNFGLGGHTTLNDKYIITFRHIRLYEFVLRSISKNLYLGLGYKLDHHWGIEELDVASGRVTDFRKYGFSTTSTSSGLALDFIYDTRQNSINPEAGSAYANFQFVQNVSFLGANSNWNSVIIDLRKYFKMPLHSTLAIWFYSIFNLAGNAPYLDLPGTGADTYNNTGRGYEQGRFMGKRMVDLEAELRFNLSRNKLIGGVIFGNAESLSEPGTNKLEVISPAIGAGLRIKFNKFSGTNACIDYGMGTKGSRGFVGNLGEVF